MRLHTRSRDMSKRTVIMTVLCLGLVAPVVYAQDASGSSDHPKSINAREHRQAERIKDGVKNKQLTPAELDKLRADEAAIRAEERVYRKSGDRLSKVEKKDLEKDLNKTSKEI